MRKPSSQKYASMDTKTLLFVVLFLVTTVVMLCIDEFWVLDDTGGSSFLAEKSIIINLLSMFASACGLSAAWEIICKRSFAREILTLNKMSDSCYEAGVEYIYKDFNEIDWYEELHDTKDFTALICYGYTWRNHNRKVLCDYIENGGRLTVIMPDYSCEEIVNELDKRLGYGQCSTTGASASTKDRIKEACADFKQMGATVKFFRRTLFSLYFIMDNKAIFSPLQHCEERLTHPAIRVNNRGSFFRFIAEDINNLAVYDSPQALDQPVKSQK